MNIYCSFFIIVLGLSVTDVLATSSTEEVPVKPGLRTRRVCAEAIVRQMNTLCLGCTKPTGEKLSPIGGGEPVIDKKILQEAIDERLSTPVPGQLQLRGTLTDICCKQAKCSDDFLKEFCCTTEERAMVRSGGTTTTSAP